MSTVYIAIGSNISPRLKNIRQGIRELQENGVVITKMSSLYRTSPVLLKDQPYFLNGVICGKTTLDPFELLDLIHMIERHLGRKRSVRFGPRTLDLDILLYGRKRMKHPNLEIPHPRMSERRFVLIPLLELNPKLKDLSGRSYSSFLNQLPKEQKVKKHKKLSI